MTALSLVGYDIGQMASDLGFWMRVGSSATRPLFSASQPVDVAMDDALRASRSCRGLEMHSGRSLHLLDPRLAAVGSCSALECGNIKVPFVWQLSQSAAGVRRSCSCSCSSTKLRDQ